MDTQYATTEGLGTAEAEHTQNDCPAAKWAALINDSLFPMPRRKFAARDVLDQAGVGRDAVLVRDHGGSNDVVFEDSELVDLAEGNVFRAIARCGGVGRRMQCAEPAKLAFVCNDSWELTLTATQTGHSLKRLLGLSDRTVLLRDYESPRDQPVADDATVLFQDGPVFTTKAVAEYCINIEGKRYEWPEATITTPQIRKLGNLPPDQQVVAEDADGRERTLREDEVVPLDPCCRFGRAPKYKRG